MSKRKRPGGSPRPGDDGDSVTMPGTVSAALLEQARRRVEQNEAAAADQARQLLETRRETDADIEADDDEDEESPPSSGSIEISVDATEFERDPAVDAPTAPPPGPNRADPEDPVGAASGDATEDADRLRLQKQHLRGLLEALVFASDSPIRPHELTKLASAEPKLVKEILAELKEEYSTRGMHLDEVAGGWVFRTSPQYAPFIRDLTKQKPVRLTRAQVETLAIIAYRQPMTRPEVDDVRGVDTGPVLKLLLERDLVRILGKRDEPGRPLIYGTTSHFLEFFGLKSLRDLPTLREFTELSDESRGTYADELGEAQEDTAQRASAVARVADAEVRAAEAEIRVATRESGGTQALIMQMMREGSDLGVPGAKADEPAPAPLAAPLAAPLPAPLPAPVPAPVAEPLAEPDALPGSSHATLPAPALVPVTEVEAAVVEPVAQPAAASPRRTAPAGDSDRYQQLLRDVRAKARGRQPSIPPVGAAPSAARRMSDAEAPAATASKDPIARAGGVERPVDAKGKEAADPYANEHPTHGGAGGSDEGADV